MTEQRIGWGWPGASRKPHFFFESFQSLCGKWVYLGPVGTALDPGRESDCAACRKKVAKLALRRTGERIEATAGKP